MRFAIVLAAVLLASAPAGAGNPFPAEELRLRCESYPANIEGLRTLTGASKLNALLCSSYVHGHIDAAWLMGAYRAIGAIMAPSIKGFDVYLSAEFFCVPRGASPHDMTVAVASATPRSPTIAAVQFIGDALSARFPCSAEQIEAIGKTSWLHSAS